MNETDEHSLTPHVISYRSRSIASSIVVHHDIFE